MADHPGVQYFNRLSHQLEDPNKVRTRLSDERNRLTNTLESQAPERRNPEDMLQLKKLEVASAAAQWSDLNHPNAQAALNNAAKGLSPTGNPLSSRLMELEAAPKAERLERFTVQIAHARPA